MKRLAPAVVLGTLLLTACQDAPPTAPVDAPPLASISDGTREGGNPFFFWLPPLVDQPDVTGVPNPGLHPELQICDATGVDLNGDCLNVLALYTTTSGPGGEVVRTNSDNHYHVQVHTDAIGLEAGNTYRWRVLLNGFELGHADVVMALNGGQARKSTSEDFFGLVDGSTLPTRFRIEEGIGGGTFSPEEGGTATLTDGGFVVAGLQDFGGAVAEETNILIQEVECSELATGRKTAPPCYEFTADRELDDGFLQDVLVGMCVDVSGLTAAEIERISLYKDDGGPNVRELLHADEPEFLKCEEAEEHAFAERHPLRHFAWAGWRAVQRHVNPWFSPAPAHAIDLGRGGQILEGDALSIIGWAVERILVYGPSMRDSTAFRPLNEETAAEEFGHTVDVADEATWALKTLDGIDGFGDYDAIAFGEQDDGSLAAAEENKHVWSPAVLGPAVIVAVHAQTHTCVPGEVDPEGLFGTCLEAPPQVTLVNRPEAATLVRNGIRWSTSGTKTGLYVGLGERFEAADDPTLIEFLSGLGEFWVVGLGDAAINDNVTITETGGTHAVMTNLTDAGLSGWNASVHQFFAPYFVALPSGFDVLANAVRRSVLRNEFGYPILDESGALQFVEQTLPAIIARNQPLPVIIE